MGLDESEVSRLLRGDVPSDDPVWGEVSSFLDTVGTVYPTVPTTAYESRHLAAVVRESRLVQSELQRPRQGAVKRLFQGTHRVLIGSVGAFLVVLTAGVGVASALGIIPLEQLLEPRPASSPVVPQASSPEPNSGTTPPGAVPTSVPTPADLPTPSTTVTSADADDDADDDAAKASAKAEKQAAKEAAKAKKEAEQAAEKARKEAEKAAEEAARAAEKDDGKGKQPPSKGSDKDG